MSEPPLPTGTLDDGAHLAGRFNDVIKNFYLGDEPGVSAGALVVACLAIMEGYGAQVPDKDWRRLMMGYVAAELSRAWGLE